MPSQTDTFSLTAINHRHVAEAIAGIRSRTDTACGLILVDATAGNGHDTLFLARHGGPACRVLAFDVQAGAIAATRSRLEGAGCGERVRLVQDSHESLADYLPSEAAVHAAMFNLGYLPGSDKHVTTRPDSTLQALDFLSLRLHPGGILSVHCYAGHPGGAEEREAAAAWFSALDWKHWRVLRLEWANKPRNPETLLLAIRTCIGPVAE